MTKAHALWRGCIFALGLVSMAAHATVVVVPQVTNAGGANVPSMDEPEQSRTAWTAYRQQLRELITPKTNPAKLAWPEEPS